MNEKLRPLPLGPFSGSWQGIPGIIELRGHQPGPHLGITALVHGNEICGLHALIRFVNLNPQLLCGRLSLILGNLDAYHRYDPINPAAARSADEDLNRVWDAPMATQGPLSLERRRAAALMPLIDSLDHLLDLHSMTLDAPPILLAGPRMKNRAFATALGLGHAVLMDNGHAAGRRLRDYGPFDRDDCPNQSVLVECGQHEDIQSAQIAFEAIIRFLNHFGVLPPDFAEDLNFQLRPAGPVIAITHTITVSDQSFVWLRANNGLELIKKMGTQLARERSKLILTPYDNCFLVMPATRIVVGQTAVRLGRLIA